MPIACLAPASTLSCLAPPLLSHTQLTPPQVLVTPVGRLKVCGLGVSEALAGEVVPSGADELLQLQRDDVVVSGAVGLCCHLWAPLQLSGPFVGFCHAARFGFLRL